MIHINAWEYIASLTDKSVDVIITDPLYDAQMDMDELRRICKGHIIMFCDPRYRFFEPDEVAIWMKPPSSKNTTKHLAHPFEEILIERHGDVYNAGLESANYNGIYYDILLEKRTHPFQKPLSLMERLVRIYSNPNDLVFDPFAGSGTTLIAAEKHGRRAVGCEIDGKYAQGEAGREAG
jgi:DNA modification methylase